MDYISTRGNLRNICNFERVLLDGLAPDGGLYVPLKFPKFSNEEIWSFKHLEYYRLVYEITKDFVSPSIPPDDYLDICKKTYKNFNNKNILSVSNLKKGEYILNLFHGPTAAFKDFALQLLGNIYKYILNKKEEKIVILGATSGDTGSAAIHGCSKSDNIKIFILFPNKMVSDVQRRQMTTFNSKNVFSIAVNGDFDDCQKIVKEIFLSNYKKKKLNLSGVNSINWVRIMGQIVYYFWSYIKLCEPKEKIIFSVPTGNFGNIYAGFVAKQMGLPVKKLIIASNSNDVLTRFMNTGQMFLKKTVKTLSPSMDIQISSNFERLLFFYFNNSSERINGLYSSLKKNNSFHISKEVLNKISETFQAGTLDDKETLSTIEDIYQKYRVLIDPHTAVGLNIGRKMSVKEQKIIYLATAHYAKFLDSIRNKISCLSKVKLPKSFRNLFLKNEKFDVLSNDINIIENYVTENSLN